MNIVIIHEVVHPRVWGDGWRLCLHWGRYQYDDGRDPESGYRFMWRRPDGSLQAARGQARIPSKNVADDLWDLATQAGWGHLDDGES